MKRRLSDYSYPNSNLNEYNLDWLIRKIGELEGRIKILEEKVTVLEEKVAQIEEELIAIKADIEMLKKKIWLIKDSYNAETETLTLSVVASTK